jgi:hypothetical protein
MQRMGSVCMRKIDEARQYFSFAGLWTVPD